LRAGIVALYLSVMEQGDTLRDRRLLVVDDDVEMRNALIALLETDGCQVVGASNGLEALDCLRKIPRPDVILLDLMMPIKDGWEFRVAQKRDAALASIPVVAMSADDSPKAAAIDAEGYVKKPFKYPELVASIVRVMQAKRLAHLDRLASLGTLAAGIAHEINNPLTYVVNNLAMVDHDLPRLLGECTALMQRMLPNSPPPELAGWTHSMNELGVQLREAREGVDRIRKIVRGVQIFSRGSDEVRMPVHVEPILEQSVQLILGDVRQRAQLVKDYQPTPRVLANAGRLGQAFLNLLLNAIDATPEGEPQHNVVRIATKTDPSGSLVVEISDTGCGISPHDLARIFEPFFTTKPVGSGTGLGLSICHGIVTSLGGEITVASELGRGTTFRVVLPASVAWTERAAAPAPHAEVARARVLVVDDEPMVGVSLRRRLELDGIVAVAVTSGEEALALILGAGVNDAFDAIVCDLHMPGMTGMDVYGRLLSERPNLAKRMIFMTGGAFTTRSREFLERPGIKWIEKPCDLEIVRRMILEAGRPESTASRH